MGRIIALTLFISLLASGSYAIEYRTSPGTIEKTGKYTVVTRFEKTSFWPDKIQKRCENESDNKKVKDKKKEEECK